MQPFPVICETCHARLKVRSESVIGQILACPKCGSMVEIVPPADWSAAEADVASPAPESEPAGQPQFTMAAWLGLPIALWVGSGTALLLAATLVAVLWTRGDAEPGQTVNASAAATTTTAPADVDESAPQDARAAASPTPPAPTAESTLTSQPEPPLPAVDAAKIAETVEAIMAPATAPTPPDDDVQPPVGKAALPNVEPARLTLDSQPASEPEPVPTTTNATSQHASALASRSSLVDPLTAVRLGPMASESLRPRDVARQLALPIQSLDLPRVPLSRLLETISDLAAVPITLDPAALTMAGMGANEEAGARARDTTVAALLADVLAKHGLAYEEQGGLLTVVKPNVDRRRSVDYELKDLVGPDDANAAELAELVRRFVEPASWKAAGGPGLIEVDGTTLRVEQTGRVQYQILMFCERLRLVRDLPPRSRYPVERLAIEPLYPQLESRLAASTTFTFLPWTRLADLFRHWQDASGVTVLVDWSALAEQELGPATSVACSIVDRPWSEALDTILTPLGLTWWAVDDRTIQITTRDAGSRVQQIEFYPVAKNVLDQHVSTAAFTAALERELESQFAAAAQDAPSYQLAFDGPSGRLIVLGTPDVQSHLASRLDGSEPQSHEGQKEE
jgi:hypothetical protein